VEHSEPNFGNRISVYLSCMGGTGCDFKVNLSETFLFFQFKFLFPFPPRLPVTIPYSPNYSGFNFPDDHIFVKKIET